MTRHNWNAPSLSPPDPPGFRGPSRDRLPELLGAAVEECAEVRADPDAYDATEDDVRAYRECEAIAARIEAAHAERESDDDGDAWAAMLAHATEALEVLGPAGADGAWGDLRRWLEQVTTEDAG